MKNILEMNRTEVLEALRAYVHNDEYRLLCYEDTAELKTILAYFLCGWQPGKDVPFLGIEWPFMMTYGLVEDKRIKDYAYDDLSNVFLRSILGNVKKTDKKYSHTFANDLGISKEEVKGTAAPDFLFAWRHETSFEKLIRKIKSALWL